MDKILLIDFYNQLHRANIGFSFKKKEPVSDPNADDGWTMRGDSYPINQIKVEPPSDDYIVVFNFFRNLRPLIELFSPDKCYVVLEGHPQFRYDLFADYKANRIIKRAAKTQEEHDKFSFARDEVIKLLQHFPITIACATKYEADDTIATLCENMKEEELTVLSGDTDYIQLLQRGYQSCQIYSPIKKTFMEPPNYSYVAWKSLAGDKSDNIPSLLSPKKALNTVNDPTLFEQFLSVPENKANFNINRALIDFQYVPEEEITLQDGVKDFVKVKEEFNRMKFASITNDNSWEKYNRTFDCLRY
jgi:5'-3' exonuclease